MDIRVIIIEMIVFAGLFTAAVLYIFTGDRKYTAGSISDYPPDIQEEYFRTHERVDTGYRSKGVILTKTAAMIVFIAVLSACAYFAGAKGFKEAFLLTFFLFVWIGVYDTFFLDFILFANIKSFRLEGTEHMDEAYHQKWFHVKGMLFPGLLFALIAALAVGGIYALIF